MMDRKGGETYMAMKRKRSLRLVPLRIMVSPAHLDFINYRAYTKNGSQGGVIRELIDKELKEIDSEMLIHEAQESIDELKEMDKTKKEKKK